MDSKQQNEIKKLAKVIYKLALREKYVNKLNKKLLLLDSIDNNLISHLHKEFPLYGGADSIEVTNLIKDIVIEGHTISKDIITPILSQVYQFFSNDIYKKIDGEFNTELINTDSILIYKTLFTSITPTPTGSLSEDVKDRLLRELTNRQALYNAKKSEKTEIVVVATDGLNPSDIDIFKSQRNNALDKLRIGRSVLELIKQQVGQFAIGKHPTTGANVEDRTAFINALKESITQLEGSIDITAKDISDILAVLFPSP